MGSGASAVANSATRGPAEVFEDLDLNHDKTITAEEVYSYAVVRGETITLDEAKELVQAQSGGDSLTVEQFEKWWGGESAEKYRTALSAPKNLSTSVIEKGWLGIALSIDQTSEKHSPKSLYGILSDYELEIIRYHNELRQNPLQFVKVIQEKWIDCIDHSKGGNGRCINWKRADGSIAYSWSLSESTAVLQEIISFFKRQHQLITNYGKKNPGKTYYPILKPSPMLCAIARLHGRWMGLNGFCGHGSPTHPEKYGKKDIGHGQRLMRFHKDGKHTAIACSESCAYGAPSPLEVALGLAIDDGVPSRGHRANIFDREMHYIGVYHGLDKTCSFQTTINYAAEFFDEYEKGWKNPFRADPAKGETNFDPSMCAEEVRRPVITNFKPSDPIRAWGDMVCAGCNLPIIIGEAHKIVPIKDGGTKPYHLGCERCTTCGDAIGDKPSLHDQNLQKHHVTCFQERFKCIICSEPFSNTNPYSPIEVKDKEYFPELVEKLENAETPEEKEKFITCCRCFNAAVEEWRKEYYKRIAEENERIMQQVQMENERLATDYCCRCQGKIDKENGDRPHVLPGCPEGISDEEKRKRWYSHYECLDADYREALEANQEGYDTERCGGCGERFRLDYKGKFMLEDVMWHRECIPPVGTCEYCGTMIADIMDGTELEQGDKVYKLHADCVKPMLANECYPKGVTPPAQTATVTTSAPVRGEPIPVTSYTCARCDKPIEGLFSQFNGQKYHEECSQIVMQEFMGGGGGTVVSSGPADPKVCAHCQQEITDTPCLFRDQYHHMPCVDKIIAEMNAGAAPTTVSTSSAPATTTTVVSSAPPPSQNCARCGNPIEGGLCSFKDQYYDKACMDAIIADLNKANTETCVKCSKPIEGSLCKFKEDWYHRECLDEVLANYTG